LGAAALALLMTGGIGRADGPPAVGPSGPCCAAEGCCAADGCKVCQPVQRMKTVVTRVYDDKCDDFCVCRPTFLGGLFNLQEAIAKDCGYYTGNCDGSCGCSGVCGRPHVKKFLLIRNREHEECERKCEIPGQADSAGPGRASGIPIAAPSERPEPRTPRLEPRQGPIQGNEPGTNFPGSGK